MIPIATYRLQMHAGFRFQDAAAVVPYLHSLGISHLYLSPIFAARPGSSHGYDVTDPTRLNPELGSEADFQVLTRTARENDMEIVIDIVPNHMAASPENGWWLDVLQNGRASPYAGFFDIDWDGGPDGSLPGKVLVPVLGRPLAEALAAGEIRVDAAGDSQQLVYYEQRFPLNEESRRWLASRNAALPPSEIAELAGRQHYELAYWRESSSRINYRRFFAIDGLVGLRVEDQAVFDATHSLILRLVREGVVSGLRIDHVDGLTDPLTYLRLLRAAVGEDTYIVVEKILLADENLADDWLVAGTSGYDFLGASGGLFVDGEGLAAMRTGFARLGGASNPGETVFQYKRDALRGMFRGDVHSLATRIAASAEVRTKSMAESEIEDALVAVTAALPVYRTYLDAGEPSSLDRRRIKAALKQARRRADAGSQGLAALDALLLGGSQASAGIRTRWQQLSGAAMAKGFEDRALYVLNAMVALNDVGFSPQTLEQPLDAQAFHEWAGRRMKRWPQAMNATSTHDTKRSEDVRARLGVLSHLSGEWLRRAARWRRLNRQHKTRAGRTLIPSRGDEHLLYQTLVGAWPLHKADRAGFGERVKAYMTKAAREGGEATDWLEPNAAYEDGLAAFIEACLDETRAGTFLEDLEEFVDRVAYCGALNSLALVLTKATAPGIPDFYQGNEAWDLSLVDPDNRRPVPFTRHQSLRDGIESEDPAALLRNWRDGRIKMLVTIKSLETRVRYAQLFRSGAYLPLVAGDRAGDGVLAFARRSRSDWAVTVASLTNAGASPPAGDWDGDSFGRGSAVELPAEAPVLWRDVFTGRVIEAGEKTGRRVLPVSRVLGSLPVALLVPADRGQR